ncbi:biotin transporter BioY [Actinocorallia herbida]|uniref:biotin transporter BioY n=1 Tax=Actinocorallia herbida TaxID=58109 RepID=UPI001B86C678|nr:biotin transporter BioY [Actinocorallia herbida]
MSDTRPSASADLAATVVFAAFIAVLGVFPGINVGGSGVPIVLQNIGPVLAACLLGARRGTAAVALFLALAALGLPLLAGGRGGVAPFVGPSGGFLFGYVLSAIVAGLIIARGRRAGLPILLLAAAAGVASSYVIGVPWLGLYTGDMAAAFTQSLVFVPGDAIKVVGAALVASVVHRALPGRLAVRPAARS